MKSFWLAIPKLSLMRAAPVAARFFSSPLLGLHEGGHVSRSGYSEDIEDNWQMIRWRGMVASAIRGKRGQKLLSDLLVALDAMPEKALIDQELETKDGDVCALGALGKARGIDMSKMDPEEPESVAVAFGVATPLVQEIVYMNDEQNDSKWDDTTKRYVDISPEERWIQVRAWVASIVKAPII